MNNPLEKIVLLLSAMDLFEIFILADDFLKTSFCAKIKVAII